MSELTSNSSKSANRNRIGSFIPYGKQWIDEDDIAAVVEALRSDWLTTGPMVEKFEEAVANFVGAKYAVGVSSGTAGLHAAMYAAGIGPGDEVIVPPMTFVASANAVVYLRGVPIFADVNPNTLLIDPAKAEAKITSRTKAILAVDYAGQPCDYDALRDIADRHGLALIADGCHALGAEYKGRKVGTLADLTVFSFHPVKHITTGEGGMVLIDNPLFAERIRRFRNHGITTDHHQRIERSTWIYEMMDIGYNYRLTDFQSALGVSQLKKLSIWLARRCSIADYYTREFEELPGIEPLAVYPDRESAWHLYVIRLNLTRLRVGRAEIFRALRAYGIGVNVHYMPVHLHPFYRMHYGTRQGDCPVAEQAYERLITLPIFPRMTDQEVSYIVCKVRQVISEFLKDEGERSEGNAKRDSGRKADHR